MKNHYKKLVEEDRRLVILRLLAQSKNYDVNSSIIQSAVTQLGHHPSRDQVHTDLNWLEEQGLVTNEHVSSVVVATLTQRGLDVAKGHAHVPGVKPPAPGE